MPALLVDTTSTSSTSPSSSSTPSAAQPHSTRSHSRSHSPDRPPVSPITPTVTVAQLAPTEPVNPPRVAPPPQATFRQQPPSLPINESENPDAIALRSAISLLQLQREKSKRDLKALQDLKQQAVADPKAFALSLQSQREKPATSHIDILTPTLSDISEAARKEADPNGNHTAVEESENSKPEAPKFPPIPQPQNVIRCPPVNWAKYHVVGESLDKMHEEQRRYPGSAEPPRTNQGTRAPPHAVAAPYSPFTDGVGEPQRAPQSWKTSKKPPT